MSVAKDVLAELARTQQHAGAVLDWDFAGPATRSVLGVDAGAEYVGPWVVTMNLEDVGAAAVVPPTFRARIEWGHDGAAFTCIADWRSTVFNVHASYVRLSCTGELTAAQVAAGGRRRMTALVTPGDSLAGDSSNSRPLALTSDNTGVVGAGALTANIPIPAWAVGFVLNQANGSTDVTGGAIVRQIDPAGTVVTFNQWVVGSTGTTAARDTPSVLHPGANRLNIQNNAAANQAYVITWLLKVG
jgi:hypothetical protein